MSCPIDIQQDEVITLAHGSGGKATARLLEQIFYPAFSNPHLATQHDGALLQLPKSEVVFTTDSFVVDPIFFPGGDIGRLAVTGTVNDLAMCGARAYYLSCAFIIEEGVRIEALRRVVASMQKEAEQNGVLIVTGDTKVVERTTGKNIFITTSGIGVKTSKDVIAPQKIAPGDVVVLSGDIGRHAISVLAAREGLTFSSTITSDIASLYPAVEALLAEGITVHCLRDLTRGGLATALVELAEASGCDFHIEEERILVDPAVHAASELLGLDPLFMANEGTFCAIFPEEQLERALSVLPGAVSIGRVGARSQSPKAIVQNAFKARRALHKLVGEQLPRIC